MPHGVFDVVAVDRLVQFELSLAVLVPAGVIERNAALPKLGRLSGGQIDELVEIGRRFLDATEFEILRAALVIGQRGRRIQCQGLVEILDCFLRLSDLGIETAAHVVSLGVLGLGRDGPGGQLNCVFAVSLGEGDARPVQQFIPLIVRGA